MTLSPDRQTSLSDMTGHHPWPLGPLRSGCFGTSLLRFKERPRRLSASSGDAGSPEGRSLHSCCLSL